MVFSIVIPSYNEEKRIETVLRAIRHFRKDNFEVEVILVDNGSTDNTIPLAKPYCDRIEIRPGETIAALRNYGAKVAEGSYVGFIDADCKPDSNWALVVKKHLDRKPRIGVVGSFHTLPQNPNWLEKAWFEMRTERLGTVNFLSSGNCAVRKEEFFSTGGFSENLITGEDYDLCLKYKKVGLEVWNDPAIVSIHYRNCKSLRQIIRREIWYGQGMLQTLKSGKISKPFFAAIMVLLGLTFVLLGLVFWAFSFVNFKYYTFVGLTLIAIPIILYVFIATIKSQKLKNLLFYVPIFGAYTIGRAISLFLIITNREKRLK